MTVDFHCHSYHSFDCLMKPERIIRTARKKGLDGIVVNDHNTIKGGLEAQGANKDETFRVIVGAEIATNVGDITGLFLKEEIKSRVYVEVVQEIKNQGGIVVLNHPYKAHKLGEIAFDGIDLIEGFNARVDRRSNELAVELAQQENKQVVAGSDAHLYSEIANAQTVYDSTDLLRPIKTISKRNAIHCEIISQAIKAMKTRNLRLFLGVVLGTPKHIFERVLYS